MWKVLCDSVKGTRHETTGTPCQDSFAVSKIGTPDEHVLCLVCADGAGSALLSDLGSEYLCKNVLNYLTDHFSTQGVISAIDGNYVLGIINSIVAHLEILAEDTATRLSDYASTLLVAVISQSSAVFAQVGDGVIVWGDGDRYTPVFWPTQGEYANITTFVTSPDMSEKLQYLYLEETIEEVCLMTDGMQMLALDYAKREAHSPFFKSMFERLRTSDDSSSLNGPFRSFLASPDVCKRTDDDKTMILASRCKSHVAAEAIH